MEPLTPPAVKPEPGANLQLSYRWELEERVLQVQRGGKDDTALLNINFKTIILQFFREKQFLRELPAKDVMLVEGFAKRSPSFKSLSPLLTPTDPDSLIPP